MTLSASELILNPDGSIYHLSLRPEELADIVITVGDPDRVSRVSRHFDHLECQRKHREFVSHTGRIGKRRITVISTGIGPDNIDIVLNELDALANIDFDRKAIKEQSKKLRIIRIGTSGCLQEKIHVGTSLISEYGLGLDNTLWFYNDFSSSKPDMLDSLKSLPGMSGLNPYLCESPGNLKSYIGKNIERGITLTSPGFYGPQGRQLKLRSVLHHKLEAWTFWEYGGWNITNFEMETAALYGLAALLGHEAVSVNALIANRATGKFDPNPRKTVDTLIEKTLADIENLP
jgi:uridine phosphorylase